VPIDASIYGNIRPYTMESPIDSASKALAFADARKKYTMDQDIQDAAGQTGGDPAKMSQALMARGHFAPAMQLQTQAAAQKKAQIDQQLKINEAVASDAMTLDQIWRQTLQATGGNREAALQKVQPVYSQVRQRWAGMGHSLPESFDPDANFAGIGQAKEAIQYLKTLAPDVKMTDTGGSITPTNTNPLAGPVGPLAGAQPIPKTEAPGHVATRLETQRHNRAIEGDPQAIETTAQGIANGSLAPLSGFALARPMGQQIMARVTQINPNFDPTQFGTRQKAEKDFATGKAGNSVRSFNVALSHLDTLDQLADALNNKDTLLVNKIGNAVSTQTGNPAPTNFVAAKKIVSDEIVKAIVGSGGGVTDREEAAKTISAANSPAQLKGVISTYKELMKGQLNGLRDQYKATTGKEDFDTKYLSEAGRKVSHGGPQSGGSERQVKLPDGRVKTFPTPAAAQRFKEAAGL
jgi:hypothetical protein